MGAPTRLHRYTFRDYLTVEEMSTVKHEFLDGEIYAMAGGSMLHAALSVAVSSVLDTQLQGRCRVYSADLRIRVLATGLASYPDVTVGCAPTEADPADAETLTNPIALVEVLSPSTIDSDLGEKFEHYKQVPSLMAVIYVWQDERRIELRERVADDSWRTQTMNAGQQVLIESLTCRLDVDALYRRAGGP